MKDTFEECERQLVHYLHPDLRNMVLDYLSNEFFNYLVRDVNFGNDGCRVGTDLMSTTFTCLEYALFSLLSRCYAPYGQVHTYNVRLDEWTLTERYVEKFIMFEIYKVFINSLSVPPVARWAFRDGQFCTVTDRETCAMFMENVPVYKSWRKAWLNKLDLLERANPYSVGSMWDCKSEAQHIVSVYSSYHCLICGMTTSNYQISKYQGRLPIRGLICIRVPRDYDRDSLFVISI